MAPVIRGCQSHAAIEPLICFTGQHREMVQQVADYFGIVPDVDLAVMQQDQTLASLTALLWVLWLLAVTFMFVDPAPEPDPAAPLRRRIMIRLRRGLSALLALLTTALLFVAVGMTIRTLTMFAAS